MSVKITNDRLKMTDFDILCLIRKQNHSVTYSTWKVYIVFFGFPAIFSGRWKFANLSNSHMFRPPDFQSL